MIFDPIELIIGENMDVEGAVKQAREKLMKLAEKLPPELRSKLENSMDEALKEVLRDGPGVASAKALISVMKDALKALEVVPKGILSLVSHANEERSRAQGEAGAFVLGGIAADIISGVNLIEDAKKRLRDHIDTGYFAPSASKKKPESKPAEAQPGAE